LTAAPLEQPSILAADAAHRERGVGDGGVVAESVGEVNLRSFTDGREIAPHVRRSFSKYLPGVEYRITMTR
jgi:hypothetical protein